MKVLILGFGDVGKTAARFLLPKGAYVSVVDVKESYMEGVEFIKENALNEEFWKEMNLEEFNAAIVALPKDVDGLMATLLLRKMKQDLLIVARCNNSAYVERFYAAGADYVIDISSVSAQMVVSTIFGEETAKRLIYENLQFSTIEVEEGAQFVGKRASEIQCCTPVAVIDGDRTLKPEEAELRPGMKVIVFGKQNEVEELKKLIFRR
jgi:Trk K+ transport system NAD-binding subunit